MISTAVFLFAMTTAPDLQPAPLSVIQQVQNATLLYNAFCENQGKELFVSCYLPEERCYVVAHYRGQRFLLYYDERAADVLWSIMHLDKEGC